MGNEDRANSGARRRRQQQQRGQQRGQPQQRGQGGQPQEQQCGVDEADAMCPVCLGSLSTSAFGKCGHAICLECAVRLRVLAKNNNCPICRLQLDTIVVTNDRQSSFEKLRKDPKMHFVRRFGLLIQTEAILADFNALLEHRCPISKEVFRTIDELELHMRRQYSLFYCDLCLENLSIFTHERKLYNRQELATHKRKGDADDKSHKGHPLCEFCSKRYFDNEALFKHLRRDHFFCHFCDADGIQHYYDDYNNLRKHFEEEHYLCTEGDCKHEQFTAVFRTQIDLQAHRAERHSDALSRSAARQVRTLDLDVYLTPRNSASATNLSRRERKRGQQNIVNEEMDSNPIVPQQQEPVFVAPPDVSAAEHFPTLGASASSSSLNNLGGGRANSNNMAQLLSVASGRSTSGAQGNRQWSDGRRPPTVEDFPSLPGSANNAVNRHSAKSNGIKKTSAVAKNVRSREEEFPSLGAPSKPTSNLGAINKTRISNNSSSSGVLSVTGNRAHVSSAPQSNGTSSGSWTRVMSETPATQLPATKQKNVSLQQAEFPSLPTTKKGKKNKNKNNEENKVAQQVQKNETKKRESTVNSTLATAADLVADEPRPSSKSSKKEDNKEGKQDKNNNKDKKKGNKGNKENVEMTDGLAKENKQISYGQVVHDTSNSVPQAPSNKITKATKEASTKKVEENFPSLGPASKKMSAHFGKPTLNNDSNGIAAAAPAATNTASYSKVGSASGAIKRAPPGFGSTNSKKSTAPPPGFVAAFLDEPHFKLSFLLDRPPNHRYRRASNFSERNSKLVTDITGFVGGKSVEFNRFKDISASFHKSQLGCEEYYRQCIEHLGLDVFMKIFPELITLLPDIKKQQELFSVHVGIGDGRPLGLRQCAKTEQLMVESDVAEHQKSFAMDSDFPALR